MRKWSWILALVVLASASLGGQQRNEEQQQGQTQKPTLGAPTEPSLYGARTSTTTDPRKLMHIRSIFVERIDNSLSDKLADGLGKMGRFRVVASRNEADAVLRGTCFDSRRLKTLHSEVFISDRNGAAVWQDIVYRPFNPPALAKAVDTTAMAILQHLGDSIRDAERKQ